MEHHMLYDEIVRIVGERVGKALKEHCSREHNADVIAVKDDILLLLEQWSSLAPKECYYDSFINGGLGGYSIKLPDVHMGGFRTGRQHIIPINQVSWVEHQSLIQTVVQNKCSEREWTCGIYSYRQQQPKWKAWIQTPYIVPSYQALTDSSPSRALLRIYLAALKQVTIVP